MSSAVLDRLENALDELAGMSLDSCTDDEVLDVLRRVETVKRRLAPVDHALVNQLESRSLAFTHGARSTAVLLRQLLRVAPAEATARVKAAEVLGHRRTFTGAEVEPRFPLVAAAQEAGTLSDRHAAVISTRIDGLPVEIADAAGEFLEQTLVEHAEHLDPVLLDRHARQLCYALDQDGQYDEHAHRDRTRNLRLTRRGDGSGHLEGDLTAECAEHLATLLDALATPKPAADGLRDPRCAGQRNHDALLDMLTLVERARLLPTCNGVSAGIVLHMPADAYATGHDTATTGHGYTIPADLAKTWAGPEARLIAVLLTKTGAIEAVSDTRRSYTEGQRMALIARDLGCSFPGCDAKSNWCQVHHVDEYRHGGATTIDNGTLLCGYHHRSFEAMGWQCTMTDRLPTWIPPRYIDPDQVPRRNTMHLAA